MKRIQRIHLVGGLSVSLLGLGIVIASTFMYAQRVDQLNTNLQSAADVAQVTDAMRYVVAGPGPTYIFGLLLAPNGI
ncbi:MAG: hypothetical protein CMJ64_07315 [Planctomycetaceae bacterium]|nr:hypothetical protein [Planctomycetaceae bacterium]